MILTATPDVQTSSVVVKGTNIPFGATVTVYRYNDDATTTILRGAQLLVVTKGTFTVTDTEAPFNVPLRYVCLFQMANPHVIQRNIITNPSFETNTTNWTAGTYRTLTRKLLVSPIGDIGDAQPFDIRGITAAKTSNLSPALVNQPIKDIARDLTTNQWYVSQNKPGTLGTATSTVISRLSATGGLLDSMVLVNGGPGEQIDVQIINGEVWIWTGYRTVNATTGATTAEDLARVRYSKGDKIKANLTPTDYLAINKFTANYGTVKLDVANDYAVIRVVSGTAPTRQVTYVRRRISQMLTSTDAILGQVGPFDADLDNPSGNGSTGQGHAFYLNTLYRYSGNNQGTEPVQIGVYTFPATALVSPAAARQYTINTDTLGSNVDGSFPGDYQSPNGLMLYRQSSGELVLVQAITVGASTARQNQTYSYVQPAANVAGSAAEAAWVGKYVLSTSVRTGQLGDDPDLAPAAPLAKVNADFTKSTKSGNYEFSFQTRLNDDPLSYYFDGEITVGQTPQSWGQVHTTYPNWGMPLAQEMTWGDFTYAYITGVTDEWVPVITETDNAGWYSDNGIWDPVDGVFGVPSDRSALATTNYVRNPSFTTNASGYTAAAITGTPPVLARDVVDGANVLKVTTAATATGSRVTFSASGLVPGTEYRASLYSKLPLDQTLQISLHNGQDASLGLVGDEFDDWMMDSTTFVAATETETFTVTFADNFESELFIDQVIVSDPESNYFDGDTPDDDTFFYAWTGTPNASSSKAVPHSTLFSPAFDPHTEFQTSYWASPVGLDPVEITVGIISSDGRELVTPVHAIIPGGTIDTGGPPGDPNGYGLGLYSDGTYGDVAAGTGGNGFGTGTFGVGAYGVGFQVNITGPAVEIPLPSVNTTTWGTGWSVYAQVATPGARLELKSSYHVYERPEFAPYSILVGAQVLNPSGSVVLDLPATNFPVTVQKWTEARWAFTLPPTVTGTYTIQIVPESTWSAARTIWQIDGVMLQTRPKQEGALPYLDGSVERPDGQVIGWVPPGSEGPYDTTGGGEVIRWSSTPHGSTSEFVGAEFVTIVLETTLTPPSGIYGNMLPDCEPINLTDPTVPTLSSWFTLQGIGDLTYEARSASFSVISRRSPVVISQVRSTATSSMQLLLKTLNERERLLNLLSSGRVLLLRNPDPLYPETGWYIAIGAVAEQRLTDDHRKPWRRFAFDFTVVDRPGGLIAAPTSTTWKDVIDGYTTWGTRIAPNSVLANVQKWSQLAAEKPKIDDPYVLADGAYG